jgi:hypothetical protein
MYAFSFLYLGCIIRWIDLFVESGTVFHVSCIMRWIDLFVESGTVFHVSCIMRWIDLLDIVPDGF